MICILAAGKTTAIAATAFTLSWTHSVEKTRWEEQWRAGPAGLTVTQGRIEGSGAGMEPPEGARLVDGAYVYTLDRPPIPELALAASGATGGGWHFCAKGAPCIDLGEAAADPIRLHWCKAP
ncbi:DUF1850 domain-containing protein [Aurantimonas sp. 22II-16-19i]|uniref:DUF1850 domain-containing protein n=1 Tax=Aurantimonas sp. 22II-16-19i TaxID=1317114 RepID=UPI0009F7E27D|nr:DUF1850 domain-containing protein [Aurantimonas sp. 22II-16-19i]ORE91628.1 hypothetical protein ATO4_18569 [Aurantimonas sp. 22II-16-19i]